MTGRVTTDGKHLALAGRPFKVRGVTYGSFVRRVDGELFPESPRIKEDFAEIEAAGLNVVRTYTLPPPEVIDLAGEMGLRLLIGLHYEDWRYEGAVARRSRRRVLDAGKRAVFEAMERCSGRPEILAVAVGNEVPADVVRVHGIAHVEDVLSELINEVHDADPDMLATYCNFPTTEYLQVEGQDLTCFNVFLEDPEAFRRYVRHLQIVAGDLPLVLTEVGLAGNVHGEEAQAESLSWQLRTADESGCAGATVFAWTDEWGVNGEPVHGWGFGLTDSDRRAKPALDVVSRWARSTIKDLQTQWPRISAVVCAYNGDQLIRKCLKALLGCDYPNLEVIVCDDGSTDRTAEIARSFPFKVLELQRGGLGAARNAGIEAATGEIVAFIDADAFCHPEWPYHLALSMEDDNVVATGGPNLSVPDVGLVERAVASSPGGPIHVLLTDDRAEHVPGCNMAYRKEALQRIGGFDPIYTAAGDDVDVCWKLLDRGNEIAFAPAAQVRHHRRDTVKTYLKQQKGYGRAERLLSSRHRHRFNRLGQARWSGFIYGGSRFLPSLLRPVVYHGHLGSAPYQGIVRRRSEVARDWATALVPLCVPVAAAGVALAALSLWGLLAPALITVLLLSYAAAIAVGVRSRRDEPRPFALRALVAYLHVTQPLIRTWGRLTTRGVPVSETPRTWSGDRTTWLVQLQRHLVQQRCSVRLSDLQDDWDLQVTTGPFVKCGMKVAVSWGWTPRYDLTFKPRMGFYLAAIFAALLSYTSPWRGVGVAIVLVAGALLELWLLRGRVLGALAETTQGARVGVGEGVG